MTTQNFWSRRGVRLAGSLAMATVVLGQLPLGALFNAPALGQSGVRYTDTTEDGSGDFLGISGLSNRDVAQAGVIGLTIFGIVTAIRGGAGSAPAAGTNPAGNIPAANAPGSVGALPDPILAGDEGKPIWDTLADDGKKRFVVFTDVTDKNDVKETPLRDQQNAPYTCFAPTDGAIGSLPAAEITLLGDAVTNKAANQKVLLKHVVFGKFMVRDLEKLDAGFPLATAAGDTLTVSKNPDGTVNVNSVPVLREDIRASNGVSHPVASVIK